MCYSNCPYERSDGSCMGRGLFAVKRVQPHCMDDEDPRIMEYEYDRMSACSTY